MYSNFKAQAIEYVKQAIEEDGAGNYSKAFNLYMNALEYFKTHLKYEKDPEMREAITQKFTEYLRRAEEIRAVLDEGSSGASSSAVAAMPKDWEENLNISSKEQATEYLKQAVQEDNAGNYPKSYSLYMNVLEYFKTYLRFEKNPMIREEITQKFDEYIIRATDIRAVLCEGGTADPPNFSDSEYLKIKVFRDQAMEYVKQAIQEDHAGNYSKAFPLYMNALEYFRIYLKYEKYYKFRDAVSKKFNEYLSRAQEIKAFLDSSAEEISAVLDEGGTSGAAPLNGGDDIVSGLAARPESKAEDREGSGGDEGDGEENIKLRAGLNSPIVREKPIAKSIRSRRLCSCFSGNT